MERIPRIGVGVLIRKDNKVLLGKRKSAHGTGSWCAPGGHLEFMETVEDCARRETMEETGLTIINIQKTIYTEDFFTDEDKHYLTMLIVADWESGEPELREPHKCEEWNWFTWDNLPDPLFLPLQNHIQEGFTPFF